MLIRIYVTCFNYIWWTSAMRLINQMFYVKLLNIECRIREHIL
jgi:hypothetical protein